MKSTILSTTVTIFLAFATPLAPAADSASFPINSLMLSPSDTSSPAFPPSAITMITNRAKTFADQVSPNRTGYFSLTDYDLHGKSNEQILQRISPAFTSTDVRTIEIVVNLKKPLILFAKPNEPLEIGTAHVTTASPVTHLDVRSSISLSGGVTVNKK